MSQGAVGPFCPPDRLRSPWKHQRAMNTAQSPVFSEALSSFTLVWGGVLVWLLHAVYFPSKHIILKKSEEAELPINFFFHTVATWVEVKAPVAGGAMFAKYAGYFLISNVSAFTD